MEFVSNMVGLLSLLVWLVEGRTAQVVVNTASGPLKGFKVLSGNTEVAVFRGIPYARPPVAQRRFKPPIKVDTWANILDTSDYGPECVQMPAKDNNQSYIGQENCLTLNIFKPMLFEKGNLPVIVLIHSGNFIAGSGKDFNGVELAKHLEAVIVTINYRLGILGFYSLHGHVDDNLGIQDQIMALQWINSNVRNFNADRKSIMLVADHIMTQLHLMSSLSKNIFARAISFDGSSFIGAKRGHTFDEEKHRVALEEVCGKMQATEKIPIEHFVWECLLKLDVYELQKLSLDLSKYGILHPFLPVFDNKVISPDFHITTSFLHCDYMAFKSNLQIPDLQRRENSNNTSKCKEIYDDILQSLTEEKYTDNVNLVQEVLRSNYFPNFRNGTFDYCENVHRLLDDFIASEIISFTNHHSRTGLTFFNFVDIPSGKIHSSEHLNRQSGDIACLLTNQEPKTCELNQNISEGLTSIVRTFLYHGYPNVNQETVWRPYTPSSKNYIYTTNQTFLTGASSSWPAEKTEQLWLNVLPEISKLKPSYNEPDVQSLSHSEIDFIKEIISDQNWTTGVHVLTFSGHILIIVAFITTYYQYVATSWGLSESQLEALVFSLILACLVLLVVTLTLFRIVCFVNGKTFYKKKKEPKKDIVLKKKTPKKEKDLHEENLFRTLESLTLNRRSAEHSDIEA